METLSSQDLKSIFSDVNNNKEYPVVVYAAYNYYPVETVVLDDGKIIIVTKEIGGELARE